MIKASELRIGNLFQQPNDGRFYSVLAIYADNIAYAKNETDIGQDFFSWPIDHIKPIPLTEEWLVKFGFEKHIGEMFEENYFCFSYLKIDYALNGYMCASWHNSAWDIELKYVHQLQNLYFALTGEELTVK